MPEVRIKDPEKPDSLMDVPAGEIWADIYEYYVFRDAENNVIFVDGDGHLNVSPTPIRDVRIHRKVSDPIRVIVER